MAITEAGGFPQMLSLSRDLFMVTGLYLTGLGEQEQWQISLLPQTNYVRLGMVPVITSDAAKRPKLRQRPNHSALQYFNVAQLAQVAPRFLNCYNSHEFDGTWRTTESDEFVTAPVADSSHEHELAAYTVAVTGDFCQLSRTQDSFTPDTVLGSGLGPISARTSH